MLKVKKALFCLTVLIGVLGWGLNTVQASEAQAEQTSKTETISFWMKMGPGGDGLASTTGTNMNMGSGPEGVPLLTEPKLKNGLVMMAKIRNEDDEIIGMVTEMEDFPEGGGPGKIWEAYWTIVVPGVGSLYGFEYETLVPGADQEIQDTIARGETWTGDYVVRMACGPSPDGWGVIIGGTGAWKGAKGTFSEIIHVSKVKPNHGGNDQVMELRFILEK